MARKATAKPAVEKAELFVGSSAEAVPLSNSVVRIFSHSFKVTPWTAGVFEPSNTALQDLVRQAEKSTYGVFIFAKDDKTISRGSRYDSTRDNVIFELGLFMGKLGPENCFILVPKNRKNLKIPSDLEGFSPVPYEDDRLDENQQAALAAACATISDAINQRRKAQPTAQSPLTSLSREPARSFASETTSNVTSALQDLLDMVSTGVAGLRVALTDEESFTRWARNVLHMARLSLRSVSPGLPADAYVAWLRPTSEKPDRLDFFLGDNTGEGFAEKHHPFARGEGLAGTVWTDGQAQTHCPSKPNDMWRPRVDCPNESYACVLVGTPGESGGVLGLGSDQGFETNQDQITVLKAFASLLAITVSPPASGTQRTSINSPNSGSRSRGGGRRRSTD